MTAGGPEEDEKRGAERKNMNLEDQNFVGCGLDEKDDHIFECHEMIRKLRKAYFYAHNSAAGLTNYCEESRSVRLCEKELEKAEEIYNQTLDLTQKNTRKSV
uniref:Uncharacterized protein n=1 Tax=viral metagenome TaxID=1070528 RepID=A0A6M3JG35_9ZZZZ